MDFPLICLFIVSNVAFAFLGFFAGRSVRTFSVTDKQIVQIDTSKTTYEEEPAETPAEYSKRIEEMIRNKYDA